MTDKYFLILIALLFFASSTGAYMSFNAGYERGMHDTLTESCEVIEVGELTDEEMQVMP